MAIPPVVIQFLADGVPDVSRALRSIGDIVARVEQQSVGVARAGTSARIREANREAAEKARAATRAEAMVAAAQRAANREVEARARADVRAATQAANEKIRIAQQLEARQLAIRERSASMAGRFAAKQAADEQRASERAMQRRQQFARTIVSGAGRAVSAAGGAVIGGARMLTQLGGGYAVADAVQERMRAQGMAADIANSGYMPNGDIAGSRVKRSSSSILAAATSAGTPYGYSQTETLEGLSGFVGKTGDLQTGLQVLPQLAELARATGSQLSDVASAAGDVVSQLGGVSDKGAAVMTVMRGLAGQGKLGAVEMKDLANQMAKLAAASGQVGGDAVANMLKFGMLAQEARAGGGAASATQAATSAQGIVNTLKTPARIAAFKAQGIDVFDQKTKMLRDPTQIIMESLEKTKGDPEMMKTMFANIVGERAVTSYANTYRKAENGEITGPNGQKLTGKQAVQAQFDKMLVGSSMSKDDVSAAAADRMQEADMQFTKAVLELKEATSKELIPAFTRMVPDLNRFIPVAAGLAREGSKLLSQFMALSASNPLGGLGVLLGAAVGKEVASAGLAKIFEATLASKLGQQGGLFVGTAMVAVALATLAIDKMAEDEKNSQNQVFKDRADATNALSELRAAQRTGNVTPAQIDRAKAAQSYLTKEIADKQEGVGGSNLFFGAALTGAFFRDMFGEGKQLATGKDISPDAINDVVASRMERENNDRIALAGMQQDLAELTKALNENTRATRANSNATGVGAPAPSAAPQGPITTRLKPGP